MSDRTPVCRSGQTKPSTSTSSVTMEDRDVLRRIERERRSREVLQEEAQYDRVAPLFSEPFKRIRGDDLSSRIQRMLGNYEDGSDEFPVVCLLQLDGPLSLRPPPLGPPALPLSPLPASDSSSSPDLRIHRPDVPPLTLTLNLPCKLANTKKPTAYVRPMDGQDQVTSDSPRLKASPGRSQDLKESSEPSSPPLQSVDASVDSVCVVSGKRAEDILQEMTSWPPLLMSICTPSSAEPPKVLDTNEESHGFTALKAHESSDGVQHVASSSSSDSDSSSDTDRNPDQPTADEPSNTQTQTGCDWHLGRWLERKDDQHQQFPGSPCDIIKANSHDTAGRVEGEAAGQQGCYSNQCDSGRVADGRQTVENTCTRVDRPSVEISQHAEKASTHRSKHERVKTSRDTKQKKSTTIANISKQTCGKPQLLVKIQLNLISRIPQEPKAARHRTGQTTKRTAESNKKFPNKKQKLDVEGKKVFSSQQSLHQKEASKSSKTVMMKMKTRNKSTIHSSSVPPEPRRDVGHKCRSDGQLRKAEAHGKKHCKSRSVFPEEPRPPTPEAHRQRSVEDHMKEAKKLKHKADATLDKMAKALCYLEAALAFVESAIAMETQPETPKSAYTMFSETLDLIRFILKLKNYTDPSATARERDFFILCLRCQSLLQMAMFRYRRDSALRHSRTLADHFRSSSWSASPSVSKSSVVSPVSSGSGSLVVPQHVQQAAASYVSITTLFLSAHQTWEQADDLMTSGTGLLRELDSCVAPLSLTASMISLVTYVRLGLRRIRCDSQNQK